MMRIAYAACAIALSVAASARTIPNPWFGTWKLRLATPEEKPETLIYSDAGHGAMRMVSVEQNSVLVTRFDGRPATNAAAVGNSEPTLAITAVSPTRYRWTFARPGKPDVQGINTLAADRLTFTEVSWLTANRKKRSR